MLKHQLITLHSLTSEIPKGLVDQSQDIGRSVFSREVQRRTTLLFQLSETTHVLDPQYPLHAPSCFPGHISYSYCGSSASL